jgi:Domain of unknown function (DUF4160)
MPELCRFYGIIIRMFWEDHPPPHFHAIYGTHEALVEIATAEIIAGSLPIGARSLVSSGLSCIAMSYTGLESRQNFTTAAGHRAVTLRSLCLP